MAQFSDQFYIKPRVVTGTEIDLAKAAGVDAHAEGFSVHANPHDCYDFPALRDAWHEGWCLASRAEC